VKDKHRCPWLVVVLGGESLVSHAGGSLLVAMADAAGLSRELSAQLGRWRRPWATHDPGKIVLDLAVAIARGADRAADIAVVHAQPTVFGLVASDPTVLRLVTTLAKDIDAALEAISAARAVARARVWNRIGAPIQDRRVVLDLDATLVTAFSEKEAAAPTYKRRFGFHPLLAYADHGDGGTGEPVATLLRPPVMPVPIPPATTSRSSTPRWHSCPSRGAPQMTRVSGRCWYAPTPRKPRTPSPITSPRREWSSQWVPTCTTSTSLRSGHSYLSRPGRPPTRYEHLARASRHPSSNPTTGPGSPRPPAWSISQPGRSALG
jgi:hypothetical protein